LKSLRERPPDWPEDKLAKENAKFVAPPEIVPPHSPGGAVDLVLVDAEGEELNMGSFLNEKGPLMRTEARGLPRGARRNRTLLLEVMENAGFVNYPHEWWHFSYGDRYWAFIKGEPAVIYGAATQDLITQGDDQGSMWRYLRCPIGGCDFGFTGFGFDLLVLIAKQGERLPVLFLGGDRIDNGAEHDPHEQDDVLGWPHQRDVRSGHKRKQDDEYGHHAP
jgi:hypothetical protein